MSNRSYLCGTDKPLTYPSFADPDYDSDNQTIACDVWCVPLLWTALFRPKDVVHKTFSVDGEDISTEAPLVKRTTAIRQLNEALPYLNQLFKTEGPLDEYASFLRSALEVVDLEHVTIELQEIACLMDPEQAYYDMFRAALSGIGNDFSTEAKERLIEIAQFRDLKQFPPARLYFEEFADREMLDDDEWNHCRVFGAGSAQSGLGRTVPWEPE